MGLLGGLFSKKKESEDSRRKQTQKVVAVYILGRGGGPSQGKCDSALQLDPDIQPPVRVYPFGGLTLRRGQFDDDFAIAMLLKNNPEFTKGGYSYKCTWVHDLFLIKIIKGKGI